MRGNSPSALALAIGLALSGSVAFAQQSQAEVSNTTQAADESQAQSLERVEVTGSRIKRTEVEGVEPVQIYFATDLQNQGFANLYDALSNLTVNTGVFIGEESTNNFHANAQALNLRGFGAGYTLVLLNGRRVPMMPKPAGTVSGNVINLAMIPTSAVERVEVLSNGASAIYGSDAVAGVVNVILKDNIDETTLNYRYGNTVDGGGRSDRFTFTSGVERGDTRISFGLEYDDRRPIRGDQRDWFDHPTDSPDPDYHELEQVMSFWDVANGWGLLDISDRCNQVGYEAVRPGWAGEGPENYCGDNIFGTYTIRNQRERVFGFANLSHYFGDHEFYMTLMSGRSKADAGLYRYSYGVDYEVVDDINAATPQVLGLRHVWRSFRDFETPTSNQSFKETSHTLSAGLRGEIGRFDYNLGYSAGVYRYTDSVVRFDDAKMLGLIFGAEGVDWAQPWSGSRWVRVNQSQLDGRYIPNAGLDLLGQLSPEMFDAVLHTSVGDGRSTSQTISADISGTLFAMPAGDAAFAAIVEASRDTYRFLTDLPTVNGDIYGWSGIRGRGDRNRYALGGELALPLLDADSPVGRLEAKVAGRYDYYDDASDVGGAATYQFGLSWRPLDWLMFRASRATSFRAPDMHVMFAERSSSYTSGVDYLRCVQTEGLEPGMSWQACGNNYGTGSIRQYSEGDPSLREETGRTDSLGMVAQLGDNHSFTLDLFRIRLEDQIGIIGASTVLRYAAECALGFDASGNTVDASSPKCVEMMARVERGGPNNTITSVITSPFNTGMRQQDGVDLTWQSAFPTQNAGRFTARLGYTHVFKTLERYLPEDEEEDIRDAQWNNEFRTRAYATLGWNYGNLGTYVHVNRLGSSPVRWADSYERHPSFTTVNLSADYRFTDALSLGLNVVNLFDKKPFRHDSEKWWPYADISKYNAVGTEYFVTLQYRM